MEYAIILCLYGIVGFTIGKVLFPINKTATGNVTQIDDKNFIVDGKFVSFETNTHVLRLEQEMEDLRFYQDYERVRLKDDREQIFKIWQRTIEVIQKVPNIKDCVTPENLEKITPYYEKYIRKCDKLDEIIRLTKEEYLIMCENPIYCMVVHFPFYGARIYNVHNEENAKYLCDSAKKLKDEYEAKWY